MQPPFRGLRGEQHKGNQPIPTLYGKTHGLKANQLMRLQRLYRRRVPVDRVVSPELARNCTELSRELNAQVGVMINRRGGVEQVIVGTSRGLELPWPSRARLGPCSLRGIRLVHTHLYNEPLNREDLTDLALLRLDLIIALGVGQDGRPQDIYVAHLAPPSSTGLYEVLEPQAFHAFQIDCGTLIEEVERGLTRMPAGRVVKAGQETAILVSVSKVARAEQEDRLAELADLADAAGLIVLDRVIQRASEIHPKYVLGSGKIKEVVIQALHQGADVLVFDQDLTPAQVHAIAELTEMKVVDRTQVILDIFARRAHSREGKVQVELAQLRYLLPRLMGKSDALSRLGGGIGVRGPGETKLETDRRRTRDRIAHLERQLESFARHQDQRRALRFRHHVPIVSIVGYTNAGKSTLLNALTQSRVAADDRPFETLDTSSRRLRFPRDREIIVTDTVGFIRDVPKDLMRAFRTTLEELRDADLLLHVVDAGAQSPDDRIRDVETVLTELDLQHIPRMMVFNKCDRAVPERVAALCRRHEGVAISALAPETLVPLTEALQLRLSALGLLPRDDQATTVSAASR